MITKEPSIKDRHPQVPPVSATVPLEPMSPQEPTTAASIKKSLEDPPWAWYGPVLDFLVICFRWKVLVFLIYGTTLGLMAVAISTRPPLYTAWASAVVMPRSSPAINARMTGATIMVREDEAKQDGPQMALPARPELFSELLQSPTVIENVAKATGLLAEDGSTLWRIKDYLEVTTTEDGLLSVTIRHPSAQTAADIANAFIAETVQAGKRIELELLNQQSDWLEQAAEVSEEKANEKEKEYRTVQAELGSLDTRDEGMAMVGVAKTLRLSLADSKIKLRRMLKHRTERDPQAIRLKGEIEALEMLLSSKDFKGSLLEESDAAPIRALTLDRLKREMVRAQDLFSVLKMQLEIVKLRKNAPPSGIAVLQRARIPRQAAIPNIKRIIIGGIGGGAVLAFGIALALDQMSRIRRHKSVQEKLQIVRRNLFSVVPKS